MTDSKLTYLFILLSAFSAPLYADYSFGSNDRTTENKQTAKSDEFWMAIVGDSSTTGAAADPSFIASWTRFKQKSFVFILRGKTTSNTPDYSVYPSPLEFNITNPVQPLNRVMLSKEELEYERSEGSVFMKDLESKGSKLIDTPEYAFGYMVGRALNVNPNHIVTTGQDGKQFDTLEQQLKRIFEVGTKTLPPLVLVSYVANDFCHPDFFDRPVDYFRNMFEQRVRDQMQKAAKFPPHPQGTKIVIVAPVDVANVLTNHELLQQKIFFEGAGQITCEALRKGETPKMWWSESMRKALIGECRGVLSPSDHPEQHIQRVRDLQYVQDEILKNAVDEFNKTAPQGLSAIYASSTKDIQFKAGDLANDCFHPSVSGHTRIARQLLSHELKHILSDHEFNK